MALIRMQVSHQGITGLPEDRYVNTFYAIVGTSLPATWDALHLALNDFYYVAPSTGGFPLQNFLGGLSDTAGATHKFYDMADAMPRTPVYTETHTPTSFTSGTGNLPDELAVCLSYVGDTSTGVPIARRRGRLYIGPLGMDAMSNSGMGQPAVPSSAIQTILTKKAVDLAANLTAAGATWVVYSPTGGVATPISSVWVDNAFDIQRRRGAKPTGRTTLAIP